MSDLPDYQEATDIEVVTIEFVRNINVSNSRLIDAVRAMAGADNAARVVQRRPIANTYQEALAILRARSKAAAPEFHDE